jgi:hypothetical protein
LENHVHHYARGRIGGRAQLGQNGEKLPRIVNEPTIEGLFTFAKVRFCDLDFVPMQFQQPT